MSRAFPWGVAASVRAVSPSLVVQVSVSAWLRHHGIQQAVEPASEAEELSGSQSALDLALWVALPGVPGHAQGLSGAESISS